jgi:broad specificity phosphatase PhoE
MRALYLVRHAAPAIQREQPAREWRLSERGIADAKRLAETAATWGLRAIYCSGEEKSRATALILSDATGAPVHAVELFDELRIGEWVGNADDFNERVRAILAEPAQPQRGAETADAAAARFAAGVDIVAERGLPAALVSHGRVIAAWLASRGAIDDAFAFWRSLPMPGWTRIDLEQAPATWDASFRA